MNLDYIFRWQIDLAYRQYQTGEITLSEYIDRICDATDQRRYWGLI